MIWFMGIKKVDDIKQAVLYNDRLSCLKYIIFDEFLNKLTDNKSDKLYSLIDTYKETKNLSMKLSIVKLLESTEIPLANYDSLFSSLIGKSDEFYYLLNTPLSTYMNVLTLNGEIEVQSRIDPVREVLNANVYHMVWPESNDYNYGDLISSPVFEYVCMKNESFLDAKDELSDFGRSGLKEVFDRAIAMGEKLVFIGEIYESTEYPGLCAYRLIEKSISGDKIEYETIEVPEGVAILETDALSGSMKINNLILPKSIMFIMSGAIGCEIHNLDMSDTQVTSLINPLKYGAVVSKLKLPKNLKLLSDVKGDEIYRIKTVKNIYINSHLKYIRNVEAIDFLFDSKKIDLEYIGIFGFKYAYKAIDDTITLYAPRLHRIEPTSFVSTYAINVNLESAPLDEINTRSFKLWGNNNVSIYLDKDSKAYSVLKQYNAYKIEVRE